MVLRAGFEPATYGFFHQIHITQILIKKSRELSMLDERVSVLRSRGDCVDTEQKRPAICCLRNPLYKDRDVKQSSWVEIMKTLFENVDDWTQTEKEKTRK